MQELRDIKEIVEITDSSLLLLFLVTVAAVLLFTVVLFYFRFKKRRVKRKFFKSKKELAKERIENIDFNDPKSVAYTFVEDVGEFVDLERQAEYEKILNKLYPYKYKKEIPPMDEELKNKIKNFIREIKWQI